MKPTPDTRAEWVLTLWVHKAALSSIASISDEDIESLKKLISRAIQDAVDEEREACAALVTQIANYHKGFPGEAFALLDAADAIRARSNK